MRPNPHAKIKTGARRPSSARSFFHCPNAMPSQRQLEANRRNGQKGGPKTEVEKQRTRLTATKHRLTSAMLVVLPDEHQHEYEEVIRGFRESFQPHNAAEEAL